MTRQKRECEIITSNENSKLLITHSLEEASEWILDNVAGLRRFELRIRLSSDDLNAEVPINRPAENAMQISVAGLRLMKMKVLGTETGRYSTEDPSVSELGDNADAWAEHWTSHHEGCGCEFGVPAK